MNLLEALIPQLLACSVILVISLRVIWQARREDETHQIEFERKMAEFAQRRAEREAATTARLAHSQADLVVRLETSDEEAVPNLPTTFKETEPWVAALGRVEQELGGRGLTVTAAQVEPGRVRLTLSPVERLGSAVRMQRIADEINNAGSPLPPGVTGASANILAL